MFVIYKALGYILELQNDDQLSYLYINVVLFTFIPLCGSGL